MFNKILIANRGEIACRVITTAKRMGIKCVAVYSEADKSALHVELADEAYCLGPAPVSKSYLRIDKIIEAVGKSGAEAVHPGYGFLSENPEFVQVCENVGRVFIGPPVDAIEAMGLKDAAKVLMEQSGVPVVPGYHGDNQAAEFLQDQADIIGYPVLIKARAGGGGKGMRLVQTAAEFNHALESAQREAQSSFGDAHVIIEKFVSSPRHIEVQVFADKQGNTVHLFERDCSMQRRHQKVIEEAPAPGMSEALRNTMGEAAVRAAKAVGYVGAGTVEFIVDSSAGLKPDGFYFMEMNTRLQVEHPVTEAITGLDLVEWQLRVAADEPLPRSQAELVINGHSFEARIYAEDAQNNFMPSIGRLDYLSLPFDQARVDSGIRQGDEITPFYDPMISKIIVHGDSRKAALARLQNALANAHIVGCKTNINFLDRLSKQSDFVSGQVNTGLIDQHFNMLTEPLSPDEQTIALAALSALGYFNEPISNDPWQTLIGWRHFSAARQYTRLQWGVEHRDITLMSHADGCLEIIFDDAVVLAKLLRSDDNRVTVDFDGQIVKSTIVKCESSVTVFKGLVHYQFELPDYATNSDAVQSTDKNLLAPMPGLVTSVNVTQGQHVEQGELLIVMEAMKMEHSLRASLTGVIEQLRVANNDQVQEGALLLTIGESQTDG